jgi:hypothetical protein
MRSLLSTFRAVVLFAAVGAAACLPACATNWLLEEHRYGTHVLIPPRSPSADSRLPVVAPPLPDDEEFVAEELDIRGNEIVRPVERYGVDPRGSLYELHSPHTEIPRLAPPEL